ncbi:MAG TPA: DUF1343 domain-containing protein [Acidobacteriota bacterium]|nr:DUF1343 domain-containing protein [Acidobacteriota bacterium]
MPDQTRGATPDDSLRVKTGLERALTAEVRQLREGRVGLISHPASVDAQLRHAVDVLADHPDIELTAIFGPQHGARGETQDNMIEWTDYRDPATGLPVFSLYGEHRKPTAEMLAEVDLLAFDLQDVGARYYTFIHTMALAMEACRENDKRMLILDRPNPIGGTAIEGHVLDPDFRSFVGLHPLAIRHGMTAGEIALYLNREFRIGCRLEVAPMEGWRREQYFNETGLPWVLPSPNIPTLETAVVYPGLCLLEGTNVSEGRGTTRPFEISGAPWADPRRLVEILDRFRLPGVRFRPLHFVPTFHKWAGEMIGGVQIHVHDRRSFEPFRTGIALVMAYRELGGDAFRFNDPPYEYEYELLPFDILCGTDRVRRGIEGGSTLDDIAAGWRKELEEFALVRRKYLLYE